MIDKTRDFPLRIKQLEALLRRLEPNHTKRPEIESDLRRRRAGLKGEQNLDYHLTFLPNEIHILHHIRLKNEHNYAFQIDTMLINTAYIYSLETKNISGELFFHKQSSQFIRTANGEREGYSNPIIQAQRHVYQLKNWLKRYKLPQLPVEYGVVISNPSTIVETTPDNYHIFKRVFHADLLPGKAAEISQKYKSIIDEKEVKKIIRTIKRKHEPLEQDVLQIYDIKKTEILPGVHCPQCSVLSMKYHNGQWKCRSCGSISADAHKRALADYALLLGPQITNQEICSFLQIPSRNIAYQLLKKLNLPNNGQRKWRTYNINELKYKE